MIAVSMFWPAQCTTCSGFSTGQIFVRYFSSTMKEEYGTSRWFQTLRCVYPQTPGSHPSRCNSTEVVSLD